MERYVGVNPNVPRMPRPALPPEVPLGPVGSGTPSPSRTTLAQRCATLKEAGPQSPYTLSWQPGVGVSTSGAAGA